MTGPGKKPNVLRTKACTTAPNVGEAFDDAIWHDLLECLWNRSWPSRCYGLPSFVGTGVADVLGQIVGRGGVRESSCELVGALFLLEVVDSAVPCTLRSWLLHNNSRQCSPSFQHDAWRL
jgi:hypothetical protein